MIVAFGNITKTAINEELPGQSDQLYILDINTFTWVKTFNPPDNNPEPASANESESNNSINTIMIILIVVAVVLIIIGSTIGIIIYRRKRRSSDDLQIIYPPHVVSQQVTASQIDADNMHQFNGDIKQHQYIASNLLPSEISSDTNHYARDSKDGDINDTNHYTINNNTTPQYGGSNRAYNYGGNSNAAHHYGGNNNTTHHYGGDNNTAHQYRSNNNITHHYGDNSQYATDTNIAPAHETFNVSPDQPFGVVMLNTQSGEMIVPPNVQTTSNYNNYNNYNYRFS
ncbi:hypothetical protein C1645_818056 [Glomus cerebriforme]|uniref:Uncharacterized protein n=1 Tax=Glomus cerebriforme TaxID=658196 RepID=A0A397T978_9GLOM|nr:hypothetical protein C1645_818056 [Glomus cerebriforme]